MTDLQAKTYPNIGQSIGITGIVIAGMLLMSPLLLIFNNKLMSEDATNFIYYLCAMGVPLGIVYAIRKSKTGETKFNFKIENKQTIPLIIIAQIGLLIGITVPILGLVLELIPVPEALAKAFEFEINISTFLLIVIAAPVLEEFIFRAVMLNGLLKKYSPVKAILISSILFAFVHLNPWQFFSALFIGIFIGWIYHKTKSLSLAIIIHAVNNFTIFLLVFISEKFFGLDSSAMSEMTLSESYGGLTGFVLITTGSILIFVLSVWFLKEKFKKTENLKSEI